MDRKLAFAVAAALAQPAAAQTYTVDSITPMSIGTVAAAASGVTTFLISADGYVNKLSGGGNTIGGPYSYGTAAIRCVDQGGNLCSDSNNRARIRVGRTGVNTGRGQTITTIGIYDGTGTLGAGTNETNSTVDVPLSGWTASNQTRTFRISFYWPVAGDDGSGATGSASSQFYVYAAKYPTTPTSGLNGTVTGTVRRALTITKQSDIRFGTIVRPTSGSGTVTIDPASGARSASGGPALVPSAAGRGTFTIDGEAGSAFTITGPATLDLINGANVITMTASATAFGSQTLTGGSFSLGVGGSIPVSSATATGSYSGTAVVTVAYN